MDFSTVKGISIPQGDVRIINDSNSNCLWTDLKFNQLVENGNFADSSGWYRTRSSLSVSNNIATINANSGLASTSNFSIYRYPISTIINGHYYYVSCDLYPSHNFKSRIQATNSTSGSAGFYIFNTLVANTWQTVKSIKQCIRSDVNCIYTGASIEGQVQTTTGEEYIKSKNYMCIDLTEMYGAGNEPNSTSIVERDCANIGHPLTEYQPYTPIW